MKTRCISLLILVILVTLSVAACTPQAAPTPAATQAPTSPPKATEKAAAPATQAPTAPPKATTPAKPAWQADWDKTLAEAKKEGKVVIYATVGQVVREAMTEAVKKKYGLELEFLVGRGSEVGQKLLRERIAGLYLADVYMGGPTTLLKDIRPTGALESIRPLLVLPEVTDNKVFYGGKLPFIDKEELVFQLMLTVIPYTAVINTDLVKDGELNSYYDLLQPKWKGKIVMNDPTTAGRGETFFSRTAYMKTLDPKFWTDLLKQEPVITRDERAQVEWVAKAKHLVGWAADDNTILVFKQAKAPIKEIRFKEDPIPLVTGAETLSLLKDAPHKNARKVFVNWLLTQEGQNLYAKATDRQGIRVDAPTAHLSPEFVRQPGVQYFNNDVEEFIVWRGSEGNKLAKQIFASVLGGK